MHAMTRMLSMLAQQLPVADVDPLRVLPDVPCPIRSKAAVGIFHTTPQGSRHASCAAAVPGRDGRVQGPGSGQERGGSTGYKPVQSGEDVACNKQPVIDLTLDVRHQTPLVAMFPARPVTWRVITCQNVVPGGCASGKTGEQIVRYGPVARFP